MCRKCEKLRRESLKEIIRDLDSKDLIIMQEETEIELKRRIRIASN